jgi:hypothetical protein
MTWLINVDNGGAMTGAADGEAPAKGCTPVICSARSASVLLGTGHRPLTISAHLVEPAQHVPAPGQ